MIQRVRRDHGSCGGRAVVEHGRVARVVQGLSIGGSRGETCVGARAFKAPHINGGTCCVLAVAGQPDVKVDI